jgi:hypothetical protein
MARKRSLADLTEADYRIHTVKTLVHMPKRDEANQILQKLINHTRLLMKQRKWRVLLLCEFYPKNKSLLGLNVNHGFRIMIRLRSPDNNNNFLPYESLLGTLLHELTHIEISAHSFEFYQMVDELTVQVQKNIFSPTYQEFSSEFENGKGNKLGGSSSSSTLQAMRLAREKRLGGDSSSNSGGRKLGGAGTGSENLSLDSLRDLRLRSLENRISGDLNRCTNNQDDNQLTNEELDFILQNTQEIAIIDMVDDKQQSDFCQPCAPKKKSPNDFNYPDDEDDFIFDQTQLLDSFPQPNSSSSSSSSILVNDWSCVICLEKNVFSNSQCTWCGNPNPKKTEQKPLLPTPLQSTASDCIEILSDDSPQRIRSSHRAISSSPICLVDNPENKSKNNRPTKSDQSQTSKRPADPNFIVEIDD